MSNISTLIKTLPLTIWALATVSAQIRSFDSGDSRVNFNDHKLECSSDNADVQMFLNKAQQKTDREIGTLTIEENSDQAQAKNKIGPNTDLDVTIRNLKIDQRNVLIQAQDENGKPVGEFIFPNSTTFIYSTADCAGNGQKDTALYLYQPFFPERNVGPNELKFKWRAPSSYRFPAEGQDTTVFNFVWQAKGPKQIGSNPYPWGTEYKITRDQDLEYTGPSSGGASLDNKQMTAIIFVLFKMAVMFLRDRRNVH